MIKLIIWKLNVCSIKETTQKMKKQATEKEKLFINHVSDNVYPENISNSDNSLIR